MSDLILHHFDASPFAEKVRLMRGLKGLAWRSVEIPMVMPKPDLTALERLQAWETRVGAIGHGARSGYRLTRA